MDEIKRFDKGSFNDYVDQILPFFDHHLPIVDKRGHFRYHLPFVHRDNSKISLPPPEKTQFYSEYIQTHFT